MTVHIQLFSTMSTYNTSVHFFGALCKPTINISCPIFIRSMLLSTWKIYLDFIMFVNYLNILYVYVSIKVHLQKIRTSDLNASEFFSVFLHTNYKNYKIHHIRRAIIKPIICDEWKFCKQPLSKVILAKELF